MIQYIDVHSHIFPEIKRSKAKVRVPYNIREQEILDDNNEVKVEYIYDEEVYEANEYFMIENENLNAALNISMFALDESYVEQNKNTDTILVAIDEMFAQIMMMQEQMAMMNEVIENLQADLQAMKGDNE
jgi:hypothetical protein